MNTSRKIENISKRIMNIMMIMTMINIKINKDRSMGNKRMIISTILKMINTMIKRDIKINRLIKHIAKRLITINKKTMTIEMTKNFKNTIVNNSNKIISSKNPSKYSKKK